jgi:hypothetical protein
MLPTSPRRSRHGVRRHGQAGGQQQRAERQHAQYISTRWASGRARRTRQMALSVRSMVRISEIAVSIRKPTPSKPRRLALARKLGQVTHHLLGDRVGNQAGGQPLLQLPCSLLNIGNAVKIARITVKSGTSADHRGERQAAGRIAQPVFAKPLHQGAPGAAPRKVAQGVQGQSKLHGRYHASSMSPVPAYSPAHSHARDPNLHTPGRRGQRAVEATRAVAVASVLGLIVLGLLWELWLAPVRPGRQLAGPQSALPLCLPLAGLLKHRMYTIPLAQSDGLALFH